MPKPHVYIFRGAPAAGKGSLLPSFCKLLPKPVALLEQDFFRWDLHLAGRTVLEVQDEEHTFAHQNLLLIYEQYLKSGKYTVVVEGLFTWDDPNSSQGNAKEFVQLAQKYGYDCTSVVLRADKNALLERNAAREYSVPPAEFDTLYESVYRVIDPGELVIESTGQTPQTTLENLKTTLLSD